MKSMALNPQQQAAVDYIDGPALVLAGAGSGKTAVITRKIAHLILDRGYLPEKIAAITFTNKAAREMKTRVSKLLPGNEAKGLKVCTFHALGLRILKQDCQRLGYRSGFSIFDMQDINALLRELLPQGSKPDVIASVSGQISRWKSSGLSPDEVYQQGESAAMNLAAEVYLEYQQKLQGFNAFDFDDLIMLPLKLLQQHPECRENWQNQLRYILVDEYQDTNSSQYQLLKLLLGPRAGLTAVGDDDQSIYGWRGAQPENLSLLGQDFPKLKLIKLEQNYRSVRSVLKAANALISNNPHTYEKALWSDLGEGDPLRVLVCKNDQEESEKTAAEIIHRRFTLKSDYSDFAVLYRSNHQSRMIEQTLRSHRIPYILSGGRSFFDRSEIKDLLCYLRLLANPRDDGAFLRVINTPRREIGAGSVEKIARYAAAQNIGLLTAAGHHACQQRLGRSSIKVQQFVSWFEHMAAKTTHTSASDLLALVIDEVDYSVWLEQQSKDAIQAKVRKQAVEDLQRWLKRLDEDDKQDRSLVETIQQLALMSGDDEEDAETDAVRLMTLHAAKGLEFPHVFMLGVEEGILPHRTSLDEGTVEEERRLMYVGITRAQRSLCLSYTAYRRRFGEDLKSQPSRFLYELPEELVAWDGKNPERDEAETKQRAKAHLANLREMFN